MIFYIFKIIRMYDQWDKRSGSDESGPDLSRRCSIHTTPSVNERERMYGSNFQSPRGSVTSFEFTFEGDWPNLKEIGELNFYWVISIF